MLVNLYKRMHMDEAEEELAVSGEIHPANLGYWLAMLFELNCDIRIEVIGEEGDEEDSTVLEEDVIGPVH